MCSQLGFRIPPPILSTLPNSIQIPIQFNFSRTQKSFYPEIQFNFKSIQFQASTQKFNSIQLKFNFKQKKKSQLYPPHVTLIIVLVTSSSTTRFHVLLSSINLGHLFSLRGFELQLEQCLRKVVREEVERQIPPRFGQHQIDSPGVRRWQLHFVSKLPSTFYTGNKIESDEKGPVEIVLVDASSNTRVTSGPMSSSRIELLVLDGDFGKDGENNWNEKEFLHHVVHEREGKRPLITGELVATLQNGACCIGDIKFTDNSRWIRGRKFRLGARIIQKVSTDMKSKEARSEAFVVKDHRGESSQKHSRPSLDDEVWRLRKISKDGVFHKRLASKSVNSVRDFMQLYVMNPSLLRTILGGGISNKTWDTITEHAKACVLDDNQYSYYIAEHDLGLLFDSIYKLVGVTFDGESYQPPCSLSSSHRGFVDIMKQRAYNNVNDFILIKDQSIVGPSSSFLFPEANQFSDPSLLMHSDFQYTDQDQWESHQGFNYSSSTSFTYEDVSSAQPEFLGNSFAASDKWSLPFNGGDL